MKEQTSIDAGIVRNIPDSIQPQFQQMPGWPYELHPQDVRRTIFVYFNWANLHLAVNNFDVDTDPKASLRIASPATLVSMRFSAVVGMSISIDIGI